MNRLKVLNLEITKKCNLSCKHCGIECSSEKSKLINEELSIIKLDQILKEACNIGCKVLIIAGGEPFLSDKIWDALDLAVKYNLSVSILTNGTLINELLCERLSKYNNIKFIRISLDYPKNEQMMNFRGVNDIVTNIIKSTNILNKYKIPYGIGMSIMHDNIEYIDKIAQISYENGAKFLRVIPIVPIGMAKQHDIDNDFYVKVLKEMILLFQKYYSFKGKNDFIYKDMITNCPAGEESISLNSNGELGLCPLIDYSFKSELSFEETYYSLRNQKIKLQEKSFKKCTSCEYMHLCKCGCIAEYTSNEDRNICLKYIFDKLKDELDKELFNNFFGFSSILYKNFGGNMGSILKIENLKKEYNKKIILNNINLNVKEGRIYGFLGPNGAGKSTTIRIILGLIKEYNGDIKIFNCNLSKNRIEILERIGALVESPAYYEHLSAYDNLKVWAIMKNVALSRIDEVLNIVNLYNNKDKKVKNFSLGMKQRLGIAQALINNPDFLILDEPTNGLDPMGIREIRNLIVSLSKKHNKTILISSHLLSEVELMVDDVGIINNGNLLYEGALDKLKEKYNSLTTLEEIFIKLVEGE